MRRSLVLLLVASGCVDLGPPAPGLGDAGRGDVQGRPDQGGEVLDVGTADIPGADTAADSVDPGDTLELVDAAADLVDGVADVGAEVVADAPGDPPPAAPDASLLPNGSPCGQPGQCASGQCVAGLCCDRSCSQPCSSCDLPGKRGTCSLVPAGTSCQAASCTGTTFTPAGSCTSGGMCAPGASRSCSPYACAPSACRTSCSSFADCAPGVACNASVCSSLPGLVLHWRLDEPSGTTALDSSGNGYHGTYVGDLGAPTPSTQVPPLRYSNARSREFVMANRHAISLPSAPPALQPPTNLTISLWYRSTAVDVSATTGTPVGSELVSLADTYLVRLRSPVSGVYTAVLTSDAGFVKCDAPAAGYLNGGWHHVAVVISSSAVTLYYGGNALCSIANASPVLYDRGNALWVGRHGGGQTQWDFGGNLDEIRIYDRALSPAEIAVLAAGGS